MKTRLLTILLTIALSFSAFGQWTLTKKYYKFTEGLIPYKTGVERDTITGWRCLDINCDSIMFYVLVNGVEDSVQLGGIAGGGISERITLSDNEIAYGIGSNYVDGSYKLQYDVDNNIFILLSDNEALFELDFSGINPYVTINTVDPSEYGLTYNFMNNNYYIENDQSGDRPIEVFGGLTQNDVQLKIDSLQLYILYDTDTVIKITEDTTVHIFKNLFIDGHASRNRYEAAAYLDPDSTIQTSVTTAWTFLGAGSANKFTNFDTEGFLFDGDTLQYDQDVTDLRDSVEFNISYTSQSASDAVSKTVYTGIFIKSTGDDYREIRHLTKTSRTTTAGVYYPGPTCTIMPLWLKDGDKIQIRAKGGSSYTLSTQTFGIYLREE